MRDGDSWAGKGGGSKGGKKWGGTEAGKLVNNKHLLHRSSCFLVLGIHATDICINFLCVMKMRTMISVNLIIMIT